MNFPYFNLLIALLPDLAVLAALFAALGVDYAILRYESPAKRNQTAARISVAGLSLGLFILILQLSWNLPPVSIGKDQVALTPLTLAVKAFLFGLSAIVVILSSSSQPPCKHVSEYYALLLLSTLSAGLLVGTENLLLLFVALETMSLSLYALTAFNKDSKASTETAFKYFTFGAVSSGFLLFGLSYFYGVVQTLSLPDAAVAISQLPSIPPLLRIAYLFIIVGVAFKIAMAPFHFWAPDVYQYAPTPIAGWIASGSKVAGFFVLLKILFPPALPASNQTIWAGAIACGAVITLFVGNLGALRQNNIKRLLAYSAIGQAGYLLTGILGGAIQGQTSVIFYILVYAVANLGAFGVINIVSDRNGLNGELPDVAGCWQRKPFLAVLLGVYFLSLAGIPPLAGFIGKFYLFFAAAAQHPAITHWNQGYYWLVGLALLFTAVALYYYLRVLKAAFVSDAPTDAKPIQVNPAEWVCLSVLALLLIAGGLFPEAIISFIQTTITA